MTIEERIAKLEAENKALTMKVEALEENQRHMAEMTESYVGAVNKQYGENPPRRDPMKNPSFLQVLTNIRTQARADRDQNRQDYMEALAMLKQQSAMVTELATHLGIKLKASEPPANPAEPSLQ